MSGSDVSEVIDPSTPPEEYIYPGQQPQPTLPGLKHFVDSYGQPSVQTNALSLHTLLVNVDANLKVWKAAVRYANDRSHALDEEVRQLDDRLAEIQKLDGGKEIAECVNFGSLPSWWWIRGAGEKQLKEMVVKLVMERRKKVESMTSMLELSVLRSAAREGLQSGL